jgi:sulfur-oxidizing protein SoxA
MNMQMKPNLYGSLIVVAVLAALPVAAQVPAASTEEAIAEYRAMFGDDNPADLWQSRGADLWAQKRGPKNQPLSSCDLGAGPGITKGAYAHLPRYFRDTGKVQDLESRLVTCLVAIQGFDEQDLIARRFGDGDKKSDLEALSAYLVAQSKGFKVHVPLHHPAEKLAYETGKAVFYYRAGPHDFSCATCHGDTGKRIRLQLLPNLTRTEDARFAFTTWPGYRVSQGELRTLEWRLADCFRQQRLPQLIFGSEVAIDLTIFIAHNAEGGTMVAPTIKR